MRLCTVDGCDRAHYGRGCCKRHWHRLYRNGDPLAGRSFQDASASERFDRFIDKTGTCWLWTGAIDRDGYGQFWSDGAMVKAHRFAHELHVGPVPDDLTIDHLCRVRNCVNPAHLEAVTIQVNLSRRAS